MTRQIILGIVAVLLFIVGYFAYTTLRPAEEASAPISAIPLSSTATATTRSEISSAATTAPTADVATESSAEATADVASVEATVEAIPATIFEIDQSASTASFTIDEVLNGAPKTVIGTTNQVAGQILLNNSDPIQSEVGVIQVNARTFTTDSNNRNNALKNRILSTNDYEYITLQPTAITGLPDTIEVGNSYTFSLTGDLTIRDTTQPTSWEVTVTLTADGKLAGSANTTVAYADWNLSIPSVPSVASVEDTVILQIDFNANPV